MAEKRSQLGKQINEVRQAIKKQSISDQVGEVEAEKRFRPITSGLRQLTAPKAPLRRIAKKKGPVPDYGLEIGDDEEVPDYGLEDLFVIKFYHKMKNRLCQNLLLIKMSLMK